jgi:shikimate kinase
MSYLKENIVLIGMPGAGKSTVGVVLAKLCAKDYIDSDLLIQLEKQRSLQQILDEEGYLKLREIEAGILSRISSQNSVISTGGSAIYSEEAILHLKKNGALVYLEVGFDELKRRISNFETRGIALKPGQSFSDVYAERRVLYERYADLVIRCENKTVDAVSAEIAQQYKENYTI